MHKDTAIIIPARIGSSRLLGKPLAQIGNLTMVEHVVLGAKKSGLDNVYVATDSDLIAAKAEEAGGSVIMTDAECQSGTDRVYQAFKRLPDNSDIKYVINLQGDMPFVEPKLLQLVIKNLKDSSYKIMTPVVKIPYGIANNYSKVKVVVGKDNKALYFSRSMVPYGLKDDYWCHVGIYGFTRDALAEFVSLPKSPIEEAESLEQLRALYNGIDIGICYATTLPISVDTPEDLELAIEEFYTKMKLNI